MLFGLDGVEIGLIIVFLCLFGGILSGFPVAFAIGGAGAIAFGIIAMLDGAGLLIHQAIDTGSDAYRALIAEGVRSDAISIFRYPELPRYETPVFPQGWETALDRNLSFIVNRINERVFAGQSIETLLAVLMFVMMGITLERSRIAEDLLTTMARVFGPLPGGLAVSVVVVGAFLAASTGIVGATVVTMGLLSLPTMLRNGYSPELSTGVIAASGTLGQIIPPSIVIVLLGTLAGDLYAAAQDTRAVEAGCSDALTYLGQPAVVSVGTLFQAALLPGIFLAVLYAAYAFGYALFNPSKAPSVALASSGGASSDGRAQLLWFLAIPALAIAIFVGLSSVGISGSQVISVDGFAAAVEQPALRTNVSEACQASMIALHGQETWDAALAQAAAIEASGGAATAEALTEEQIALAREAAIAAAPPIGTGLAVIVLGLGLVFTTAQGIAPERDPLPLFAGGFGLLLVLAVDILFIGPLTSPLKSWLLLAIPFAIVLWACRHAVSRLAESELLRVVFPPLILIVAVLGSILGGITNPTPAAALGAAGAIMLAAYRRLKEEGGSGRVIILASFALVLMILIGVNFDLRINREDVSAETWIAFFAAQVAYLVAGFGLIYACWVLFRGRVLSPVVRETAKVTSMVFTILIGSQLLNLVVISFGGEHYIQQFLRSFDSEFTVFLIVMLVLFILGFVLDFLEIIYIVIPIVGPVIYGGEFDPKWVTIMIAVNLQTSFLTPPFGFALFYLRGVAPPEVTTGHIYRGVAPFVLIQVLGLAIMWFFPQIVTIVPDLMPK
ncbi:TRAP transporter large permease [Poseidonocella sedimentorum]|uniref:Tripartite ATP-independent transporter, DctM component n=1 Tax=Poseidonocella sedimentorum TaxID=871652 RepID=A0A1I6DEM3_9RHOB|nr:TRAP transporter large permease subunit [Poseidonocella sedimentorum]SFR03940.1 Tripartite ATP-independent transporter, DctM component [Poseidonocella sedimentorum]